MKSFYKNKHLSVPDPAYIGFLGLFIIIAGQMAGYIIGEMRSDGITEAAVKDVLKAPTTVIEMTPDQATTLAPFARSGAVVMKPGASFDDGNIGIACIEMGIEDRVDVTGFPVQFRDGKIVAQEKSRSMLEIIEHAGACETALARVPAR